MNKKREARLNVLYKVIERFRIKGALNESSALTIEELGLPLRFKDVMSKRIGKSEIFIEINGKYYLSEERFREIKQNFSHKQNS
ncbi:hypothetical protein JW865_01150 [Candidatus Bathyarchaeota archaeon]|nr:hypothetical protein [Candidatus Bathyarchaeota archaeon]